MKSMKIPLLLKVLCGIKSTTGCSICLLVQRTWAFACRPQYSHVRPDAVHCHWQLIREASFVFTYYLSVVLNQSPMTLSQPTAVSALPCICMHAC